MGPLRVPRLRRLAMVGAVTTLAVLSAGSRVMPARALPVTVGSTYVELAGNAYTDDSGQLLGLDIYEPRTHNSPTPAVLVVHGGGWAGGSRSDMDPEAQSLAQAGYVAISADYRLATDHQPGFPNAVEDLESALTWIRQHAFVYGIDPARIGALGVSAGANLALTLGVRNDVAAAVSWSGPTDLAAFETPALRCTRPSCGPLSMPYAVYRFLGCLPATCPSTYRAASPSDSVRGSRAAFLIWNSMNELVPVSQAREFMRAAQKAHVRAQEVLVPGDLHGAEYINAALSPSVKFLRAVLGLH